MTHRLTTLGLLVAVGLLGACARYEWVNELDYPGGCPTAGRGPFPRRGTFHVDTGVPLLPPGEIMGTVIRTGDAAPVAAASVTARPDAGGAGVPRRVQSDSLGRFRINELSSGRYELATRRLGYAFRYDTLLVGADGVRVQVGLEPQAMDGPCSGLAMVRVRKPWWKVW
jgi:hypothetical protein